MYVANLIYADFALDLCKQIEILKRVVLQYFLSLNLNYYVQPRKMATISSNDSKLSKNYVNWNWMKN